MSTHPERQMLNEKALDAANKAFVEVYDACNRGKATSRESGTAAAIRAYLSAIHSQEAAAPSETVRIDHDGTPLQVDTDDELAEFEADLCSAPATQNEARAWWREETAYVIGASNVVRTMVTDDAELAEMWRKNPHTTALVPLFASPAPVAVAPVGVKGDAGDAPENTIDNPKSWAAWKREAESWRRVAERLEAEKQAVASTATEARAYLVCNPMIPKAPLAKGKGKFPEAEEWLYPAHREADARSMARLVRGDLIPLYGKDDSDE